MFICEDVKLFSQHIKAVKVCGKEGGGVKIRDREGVDLLFLFVESYSACRLSEMEWITACNQFMTQHV